jgi:hypothetical protein
MVHTYAANVVRQIVVSRNTYESIPSTTKGLAMKPIISPFLLAVDKRSFSTLSVGA